MTKDIIYIFDKLSFQGQIFGEIQSGFNMSNVIDGTKDSLRVVVWSFQEHEIEPYTILFHKKTLTWWIVSHDKVERRQNDIGFYWVHNIDLLGAIELLNARDLTDCGFNDNKYTIKTFIDRLLSLSTFEYKNYEIVANNDIDLNKNIDFIKTFENYTLLSALRELLDAYNTSAKLDFDYIDNNDILTITKAYITLVSKTGNLNSEPINIDVFNDVRETKTLDKNSFGSCVISNADNVISSIAKTFPSVGTIKLSSTTKDITPEEAILRLPSKVFKGNWLQIRYGLKLKVTYIYGGSTVSKNFYYQPNNEHTYEQLAIDIKQYILDTTSYATSFANDFEEDFLEKKYSVNNLFNKVSSLTTFDGNKLVPYFGADNTQNGTIKIEKGDNVPYLVKLYTGFENYKDLIFCSKEEKNVLADTDQGIAWERGSNIISGFKFLSTIHNLGDTKYTDLQETITSFYNYATITNTIRIEFQEQTLTLQNTYFVVNYIPMSDIKIKVDNYANRKDIQLYNQNGKLTDTFALSRLINSYAKEISSDNITKFAYYYDYNKVPKVGQLVKSGNEYYVINNISITFYENEGDRWVYDYVYHNTFYTLYSVENRTLIVDGGVTDNRLDIDAEHYDDKEFGYFMECEITMSKNIAVKSLMVNPNSNIRDYGIPQNFNVKRKQVHRDYYELTYSRLSDSNQESPYFPTDEMFIFSHDDNTFADLTCVIRIDYKQPINGSNTWYYQLETTNYFLNKMLYVMLDFNDNNIIGYGSQNVYSGFVISRIFDGFTDTLNTPISYVDVDGECQSIDICYCTNEQLTSIYQEYQDSQVGGDDYTGSLYNYSCFIPKEVFDKAKNNNKIEINEQNYNKDALEVPVFEYGCQIGDTNDCIVGDNVFRQYGNEYIYFYVYKVGDNFTENNAINDTNVFSIESPNGLMSFNYATLLCDTESAGYYELEFRIFEYGTYNSDTNSWYGTNQQNFELGKDYAFFRIAYNLRTQEQKADLMFIAKKVQTDISNLLKLKINHYKLN